MTSCGPCDKQLNPSEILIKSCEDIQMLTICVIFSRSSLSALMYMLVLLVFRRGRCTSNELQNILCVNITGTEISFSLTVCFYTV